MGRMRKTNEYPMRSIQAICKEQSASLMPNVFLCLQGMVGITSQQAKRSSFNRSKHLVPPLIAFDKCLKANDYMWL